MQKNSIWITPNRGKPAVRLPKEIWWQSADDTTISKLTRDGNTKCCLTVQSNGLAHQATNSWIMLDPFLASSR